jgi:hypothetical protein
LQCAHWQTEYRCIPDLRDLRVEAVYVSEVGDVTLNSGYISADLRDCRHEFLLMASGDVTVCVFGGALLCCRESDNAALGSYFMFGL